MRLIASLAFVLAQSVAVLAQTPEAVKTDILAALSTPMPITVIGPIVAQDVKVTASGDSFEASLVNPSLMGFVPLGSMSFKLTPQGDKAYRVTELKLPATLDFLNMATLTIGSTSFDGLWSTETRSYQSLGFKLTGVDIAPKGAGNAKVTIGALALDVAKEGQANATESKFVLHAEDVVSKELPPDNISAKSIVAELKANGETPVDLYAVLSRFLVLSMMQGDSSGALQFAESLRSQNYDTVNLTLAAQGVDVLDPQGGPKAHLTADDVKVAMALTGVTPQEWGTLALSVNSAKIADTGILGVADMKAEQGSFALDGNRIPIGATLDAIAKLQALSKGEPVELRMADVMEGLLNMGALKVTSGAKGISYLPDNADDPVVRIGSYQLDSGTDGFRDSKGRVFFASALEDMAVEIKHFATPLQEKSYRLFNPKRVRYDLAIADLNEGLLRKLMADVVIRSEQDYAALAVPSVVYAMALKPTIETKDMRFESNEIDVAATGHGRFYPAWVLGALAYEGENTVSLKGVDKLLAYIAELKAESVADTSGLSVLQSFVATFKALATTDGEALKWSIKYPKANEGLMLVNDTELRFPGFATSLAPLFFGSSFISPSLADVPAVVDELTPPAAVDETAPAEAAPTVEAPADTQQQ